jgi:hypothetical protein
MNAAGTGSDLCFNANKMISPIAHYSITVRQHPSPFLREGGFFLLGAILKGSAQTQTTIRIWKEFPSIFFIFPLTG